jgi:ribosomal protein L11 methyltransferase
MSDPLWQLSLEGSFEALSSLTLFLEETALAVSLEEKSPVVWEIKALYEDDPLFVKEELQRQGFHPQATPLPERDWLAENRKLFQPLSLGRFFIYGSAEPVTPPAPCLPLCIDASTAFGTGAHATTQGCLLILEHLEAGGLCLKGRPVLDVGTGTGILAMGAARLFDTGPLLATDIDPEAILKVQENLSLNALTDRIHALCADGLDHPPIRQQAPYALVLANILANPLIEMAPGMASLLAADGTLILSGFTQDQSPQVLAAYQAQGMKESDRFEYATWVTLALTF